MNIETEGLNINQAAEKLGVSVRTVRRRIKEGSLRAIKIEGRFGEEYRIFLDEPISATAIVDEPIDDNKEKFSAVNQPEVQQLLKVISDLSQQNVELARRVGAAESKVQILSEKLQLLEAPKEKKRGFWDRIFG